MHSFLYTSPLRLAPSRALGVVRATTLLLSGVFLAGGAASAQQTAGKSAPAFVAPVKSGAPAAELTVADVLAKVRHSPMLSVKELREEIKTLKANAAARKQKRDVARDALLRSLGRDPEKEEAAQQAREAKEKKELLDKAPKGEQGAWLTRLSRGRLYRPPRSLRATIPPTRLSARA